MTRIENLADFMETVAPPRLAEDWDNVGLLVGDPKLPAQRVMTCLTVTPDTAAEAIEQRAQLIVTHHPLPFRPFKQLTTDNVAGKLLWDLIGAGISIYSPHTSFDSARQGINQSLAERLKLTNIRPLIPILDEPESLGAGRIGEASDLSFDGFARRVKSTFGLPHLQLVEGSSVSQVAIACGSGGSFLESAHRAGCDTFVTGETSFHTCLDAQAKGMGLILVGHYSSERFAVEQLAERLSAQFPDIQVWASSQERDPLNWA